MTGVIPVSVIIPVRNEEANLPGCLDRLGRFAEVVVLDSGSEDRTAAIAQERGAKVIQFSWNGSYPKKRNWYLLNHKPACAWVLFLDADELIDPVFCDEIAAAIAAGEHDGFWLSYRNHFRGKSLRHGDPQRKLALFRFGSGLYERIDEERWSALDMEVHEHPIIDGSVGRIETAIDHDDDRGIARFLDRHRDYAQWEARRLQELKAQGSPAWTILTGRQRFKYRHLGKSWFAFFYFFYAYLFRLGLLDGSAGFSAAFYKFWYFHTIRLLIEEQARQPQGAADPIHP